MHQLESGIPIPPHSRSGTYPFPKMGVGQSFQVSKAKRRALLVAASGYKAKTPGWNYTTKTDGDLVRLWRTS